MESQENYNKYMRGCSKQLLSSSFVCEAECFKRKTNLGEVNKPHTCSLSCSTQTKRLWKSVKIKTLFVTFLSIYHHYNLQITLTHIYNNSVSCKLPPWGKEPTKILNYRSFLITDFLRKKKHQRIFYFYK